MHVTLDVMCLGIFACRSQRVCVSAKNAEEFVVATGLEEVGANYLGNRKCRFNAEDILNARRA